MAATAGEGPGRPSAYTLVQRLAVAGLAKRMRMKMKSTTAAFRDLRSPFFRAGSEVVRGGSPPVYRRELSHRPAQGRAPALGIRALQHPRRRTLLARSTRQRLADSVLLTLVPIPLDDQSRTQSVEASWIYVAEGVESPRIDDVTALAGSMRQVLSRPDGRPVVPRQCIVDTESPYPLVLP